MVPVIELSPLNKNLTVKNMQNLVKFVISSVAVMFPIMDMANKIIRNSDDKFHKFFISKVSAQ